MHSVVRRLVRRLDRAVTALRRADATTDEWSADAVAALKRLVHAQQTALLVHDAAGTRVYGDAAPADALRCEAADLDAPAAAARGFRARTLLRTAHDDVPIASPAPTADGFEVVGLIEAASARVLVGVCCTFDPPLDRRASATRLRLLRAVQPALASGVQARLARHAAEGRSGRPILMRRFRLTDRECDVAWLLQAGRTNLEIAGALGISPSTARHHTERVLTKLDIRSRAAIHAVLADAGAGPAWAPAIVDRRPTRGETDRALPLHVGRGPSDRRHGVPTRSTVVGNDAYGRPRVASRVGHRPTTA